MTGEHFVRTWANGALRKLILSEARRLSGRLEIQEEYIQDAWLVIGVAPDGYSAEEYLSIARRVMRSAYLQQRREMRTARRYCVWGREPEDRFLLALSQMLGERPIRDGSTQTPERPDPDQIGYCQESDQVERRYARSDHSRDGRRHPGWRD